jgi:AraC-type DNA-binding domain-containing proteins
MLDRSEVGKRGYLDEDFRLFHLKDTRAQKLEYHYHEFDKLILLLRGRVTYMVEGVTYFLKPWDILLVQHNLIHRPIIESSEPYERVVVWLGNDWLERRSDPGEPLSTCFDLTRQRNFHLLRSTPEHRLVYMRTIQNLEAALRSQEFGHARLADTYCQQLLISVNRDVLQDRTAQEEKDSYRVDPKMEEILRYITENLAGDLDVDSLAGRFYLSRYYLMHRFKAVTGYSVHQYVSQKRLLRAGELIRSGMPVMKAAEQAGFREYSTFLRAFQNTFHTSPRSFQT